MIEIWKHLTFVMAWMSCTAHMTSRTGINNLTMIKDAIKNGENVDTKQRTQFGSNELTEAIFPVPKNDTKIYRICGRRIGYNGGTMGIPDERKIKLTLMKALLKSTSWIDRILSVSSNCCCELGKIQFRDKNPWIEPAAVNSPHTVAFYRCKSSKPSSKCSM